jgi:hypothetical protein
MDGNSQSRHRLTFVMGDSPEQLMEELLKLSVNYKIISIYSSGVRHIAWIYSDMPIFNMAKNKSKNVKSIEKINKELNG